MAITQGYASLSQVKAALRITDSVDDSLLEMAIESGSRAIDGYTNRSFSALGTATRIFTPMDYLQVEIDGLPTSYTHIRAVGDYLFTQWEGEATVEVTGTWGWSAVPIAVTQACVIQSSRIYKRLDSPLGVAGISDIGIMRVSNQLDPDVAQLVSPYRRIRFA
jgi:hypothetical protein